MLDLNIHKKKQPRYLLFLACLYVVIIFLTMVIENRIIVLFSVKILSGTLIIPLSYVISDIITEIYGYKEMRRLIWTSFALLYIAALLIFVILQLPSGMFAKENKAYNVVFSTFLNDVITYSIAAFIGIFSNSYILSKWKILTKGRFFWLRSLGSTMIGEAIFILVWGIIGFSYKFPLNVLFELMFISYLCKILYNLLTIIPSAMVVSFLKKREAIDVYDIGTNFNPFYNDKHQ